MTFALYTLYGVLGSFLFVVFTWVSYLSVMNLMRVRATLKWQTLIFAYPIAAVGIVADFLCNVVIGTVLFLALPKDLLLTKRLKRYLERDDFRGSIAHWICEYLLDPFDPKGSHCGNKPPA